MIKSVHFASVEPGPRLLVTGAVHGDEICGPAAIKRVIGALETGAILLKKGSVTFVPVCNPQAYAKGVRFIERNLNRFLVPQTAPDCYEARLGNLLCPLLEQCDVLLDLHSDPSGNVPFVFVGAFDRTEEVAFAASLGAKHLVAGWAETYARMGRCVQDKPSDESTGTTEYARRFGAKTVTLECGQHQDPAAQQVAYHAILRALASLDLTDPPSLPPVAPPDHIAISHVFYKDAPGFFARPLPTFAPVHQGEILARYDKGGDITAPFDGVAMMASPNAPVGTEWFYLGKVCGVAPQPSV